MKSENRYEQINSYNNKNANGSAIMYYNEHPDQFLIRLQQNVLQKTKKKKIINLHKLQ